MLHTYNKSWIPQMAIYSKTLINKGIEYECNFLIVPGNGPALLGTPDCECLHGMVSLLSPLKAAAVIGNN